jgi:hypothetical protein
MSRILVNTYEMRKARAAPRANHIICTNEEVPFPVAISFVDN